VPDDTIRDLESLGVTVVTQPNFVAERGDQYLTDIPAEEQHELWRVASLADAGVKVALSTDMPFGDGDPWAAMRAAVHRTTATGAVLSPDERITPRAALTMFFVTADEPTQPRAIAEGQPGDLVVLSAPPNEVVAELDSQMVAATVVAGQLIFER
jgi:predicted amidohydrolase YtcJ